MAGSDNTKVMEYTLRLPGKDDQDLKHFIGTFPLGPPGFRDKPKSKWRMAREHLPGIGPPRRIPGRPPQTPTTLTLEEKASGAVHRGNLEASLGGTAANYFLLVKRGPDFVAMPVSEWYNFRPVNARRGNRSVEDAEAIMRARAEDRDVKAMPRLAELAKAGPGDEDAMRYGAREDDSGAEDGDSDVEERLARLTTKGRDSSPTGTPQDAAAKGNMGQSGGSKQDGRQDKREDWEHEDDRADDDLDMGQDDADDMAPAPRADDSDEEGPQLSDGSDGAGGNGLSKSGAALQKLLRKTGLDSDDDADEPESRSTSRSQTPKPIGYEDDDLDDEDDEEFLAKMAGTAAKTSQPSQPAKVQQERPPAAPSTVPGDGAPKAAGRGKRKGEPEADGASTKKARGSTATGSTQGAIAAAGGRKLDAAAAASAASPAASVASSAAAAAAPPTQQEVVDWLKAAGPVAMSELTARFKRRLKSEQDRKTFGVMVKRVARLEELTPGSKTKFIVLREK